MPTGFSSLNTTALPAATIPDGSAQFDAVVYAGNSGDGLSTTQDVTTVLLRLVWIKDRTGTNSTTFLTQLEVQVKNFE